MKSALLAVAAILIALPSAAEGNPRPGAQTAPAETTAEAPMSPRAQQAFDACPGLMSRTESAVAYSSHVQYYYLSDCECMAKSIDFNTWDEPTASYSGPKMPSSDGDAIINALTNSSTIEDAFSLIDSSVSDGGYSAISACYGK